MVSTGGVFDSLELLSGSLEQVVVSRGDVGLRKSGLIGFGRI